MSTTHIFNTEKYTKEIRASVLHSPRTKISRSPSSCVGRHRSLLDIDICGGFRSALFLKRFFPMWWLSLMSLFLKIHSLHSPAQVCVSWVADLTIWTPLLLGFQMGLINGRHSPVISFLPLTSSCTSKRAVSSTPASQAFLHSFTFLLALLTLFISLPFNSRGDKNFLLLLDSECPTNQISGKKSNNLIIFFLKRILFCSANSQIIKTEV